jgi:hypothetical protein
MHPGAKRLKAMDARAQLLAGGVSSGAPATSGRQQKARFRYPNTNQAAFVELMDDSMTPDDLQVLLLNCPGVEAVEPHRTNLS